jgi:AcrR family transcriptional regulator
LFGSKDGLVGAYVERMHQGFQEASAAAADQAGPDPRDQILAIFDEVLAEVNSADYRGCPMLMTLTEFPDPELPAHHKAVAAKSWLRSRLGELTGRLAVDDPEALADHLMLVLEGVHASGQSLGPNGPVRQARRLAESMLSAAAPRQNASSPDRAPGDFPDSTSTPDRTS